MNKLIIITMYFVTYLLISCRYALAIKLRTKGSRMEIHKPSVGQ